jgi:ectoine hydroxylase-related dioxygenase (phytanoyl-CoA dioxygenase family)
MDYFLNFKVNERNFSFDVKSTGFNRGKDICDLQNPVYSNKELLENGYILENFPKKWYNAINKSITKIFSDVLGNPKGFSLEQYHAFVDENTHKKTMDSFRGGNFGFGGIHLDRLGIDYRDFDKWINKVVDGKNLSAHVKAYFNLISVKNFWVRIIRPNSVDNNPPHKDTHVKRIKDNINIYLPLAGSNKNSSLPLIPKSHIEKESEYIISDSPCYVEGKRFTVPSVVHRNKGLNLITPNPQNNEIMIFDPHCIHGGGINSNKDVTRVSLEMRFFKSKNKIVF